MPKVVGDRMIPISEDDKRMLRSLGYEKCAIAICKSRSYIRSLAAKGDKTMREKDLEAIKRMALR